MRRTTPRTRTNTHTELNRVHNVQCFHERLYQECNVSITPLPGAVTTSPVNAGNTVDVQVLTPDEEPHTYNQSGLFRCDCDINRTTLIAV